MIPLSDGTLRYSPRDLIAYLEGDFAAWCDRMHVERRRAGGAGPSELDWATPDENDPETALAIRLGNEHEQRWLQRFRERHPTILELDRTDPEGPARTLAAMAAGIPAIYQAHLVSDGWGGYPDFLVRCATTGHDCAPRGWHYTPWDTKLARSAKPAFLLQLCAYADLIEAIDGFRPAEVVFILGHGEERAFQTRHFLYYYRHLRRSFTSFQSAWDAARCPEPGLDRSWGNWEKTAEKLLEKSDHLSLVANITRGQVRRLEAAGIATLSALATLSPAQGDKRPKLAAEILDRLHHQARLQLHSRGHPQPLWQHRPLDDGEKRRGLALLPPPSDGDVFFDMEGFPYAVGGLEYLFGALARDGVTLVYRDWWAHDESQERAAFEGFVDWLVERRRQYPDLHVYHYASYEESAVKRLMGKYATRETEVDELLRGGTFVDLYDVVRQGFVIGTSSYSLKKIEHLYMAERTGPVLSAGGSVVEYQKWIDSGEPRGCDGSPILKGIRDYNEKDCESTWALRSWLLDRQRECGIAYVPESVGQEEPEETDTERAEVEALARRLVAGGRLDQLVGWLAEFHRREERPMWWRMFDRHDMTVEERYDDRDCLARLTRTATPARKVKLSSALEYGYDPGQETKLHAGDRCYVAGTDLKCVIVEMDEDAGLVQLKVGPGKTLPDHLCLIPVEYHSADPIKRALRRYAEAWERGEVASRAVDDLLHRRKPRITGHDGGPLVGPTEDLLDRAREIAVGLEDTTLCIQGPPGTGKTWTAARIIVELLRRGLRIGVTSQSHKVILNLMDAVVDALGCEAKAFPLYKVVGGDEEPLPKEGRIRALESKEVAGVLGEGAVLVGGTAWVFSRPELATAFDYLFIDEAGQVSLANAVAVGQSARNLVLVGDQMQLAQVTQGHHPGDTGLSCLEYFLDGHATVPPDLGIFLGASRRMHPDVCRFISEAVYDSRLGSIPETARHRVLRGPDTKLVTAETGIVWHPVGHDGNRQSSDEECDAIVALADELLHRRVVDGDGVERGMTQDDILIVAPFNAQVRCLRRRLDPRVRIGSVDKFQGREAPVVIVSLCSSTLEEAPRGASFLLNPNRLNVAVSRAEALAIVVGCPELMDVRCRSIEEMRLVNLLCHLVQYAASPWSPSLRSG